MRWTATLALAVGLMPAISAAAAPCPAWRERQTIACMRGYLRVDPAALVLAEERPGAALGLSLGLLRTFGDVALGFGGRAGHESIYGGAAGWGRTVHAGPELRLGGFNPRAYGYMLVRGGYSRRLADGRALFDLGGGIDAFHYGIGVGVWGRLGRRFLLGGEGVLDVVQVKGRGMAPTFLLALTLGAWL